MTDVRQILDYYVDLYNRPSYIDDDPIQIPHQFSKLQDIEIAAFWTSMLAWGNRVTIIKKAKELFAMMDNAPYEFIMHHSDDDLKKLVAFKHRTFQSTDTLYFVEILRQLYLEHDSLEMHFVTDGLSEDANIESALVQFRQRFFDHPYAPLRTQKHVSSPLKGSRCKRLNMFLRWMVRDDDRGVDFGLWKRIKPCQLLIPLDVHVERIARRLSLLERKSLDWKAVLEITQKLKSYCPEDPVKYDFALFGIGVFNKNEIDFQNL